MNESWLARNIQPITVVFLLFSYFFFALLSARSPVDDVASDNRNHDIPDPRGKLFEKAPDGRADRCQHHGAGVASAMRFGVSIGPLAFFSPWSRISSPTMVTITPVIQSISTPSPMKDLTAGEK